MPHLNGVRWLATGFAGLALLTGCDHPERPQLNADLLAPMGSLAATTSSSGADVDPDGYLARVDAASSQHIDANGLATFSGLSDGNHRVDLYGVAGNCWSMDYDPRTVAVIGGVAGATRFDVGCVAQGSLYVTNSTAGVDLDPDGYTVSVDGSAAALNATNDSTWFNGVATGSHAVALTGIAANCTVSGPNPQQMVVTSGGTASIAFAINCTPVGSGTGTLTVTTSTAGANPDPDGYTLTIDGAAGQPVGTNDAVSVTGPAGDHPVALSGIASNCAVSGANPQTVFVPASGTGTASFTVTCGATPPPEARGEGQLKMGPATVGSFVQTFAFDVRADLTGRFTLSDFSNSYPDGSPATVVTDPVADPATSFTAYRNGSSACDDPSRGVEFDAVGRDPGDGSLFAYTVEVCDNGQPGSGSEFLSFYIPSKQYGRSGILTRGDITKR